MSDTESIIDTSKPNAGRIYDYFLGGHHNFEVDRQAAEYLISLMPFVPKFARLQRWCLQDLAIELTEKRDFDIIIDFASGLPTNDHIHHVVPEGTKVIYSDHDPVVVEYAREILADTPNVYFFQADARRPEELLNRSTVQEIIGDRRNVGLVYWGISIFLTDEDLSHAAHSLYEWSGPKSCWAFQAQGAGMNSTDPSSIKISETYAKMGTLTYPRPLAHMQQLIVPWKPDDQGFITLLEWHSLDENTMTDDDRQLFGEGGGAYGSYLIKE